LAQEQVRQFISGQCGFVGDFFADEDDVRLDNFVAVLQNTQIQVVGSELIFGQLYDKIGYGKIKNEMFLHLVVSRLFSPGSKLRTIDYLDRFQGVIYSIDKICRFLDTLCKKEEKPSESDIKTEVEQLVFEHIGRVLHSKITVAFYD
jgi:hypothetical protein